MFERMVTSLPCLICHVSCVMCHVSHVTCHMSRLTCHKFSLFLLILSWQNGGASRWRVCYQWGLPHLDKEQTNAGPCAVIQKPSSLSLNWQGSLCTQYTGVSTLSMVYTMYKFFWDVQLLALCWGLTITLWIDFKGATSSDTNKQVYFVYLIYFVPP